MIFQLFETQAFLAAVILLTYAAGFSVALLLIGVAFLFARRLTSPHRVARRRFFRIGALTFIIPGSLVGIGLVLFIGISTLWPEPKIEKAWDFSIDRSMTQFDLFDCANHEGVNGIEHICIYEGNITLSIHLPDGRNLEEPAKLVWVYGRERQITKLSVYSIRYDLEEVEQKVDAYIRQWQLDPKRFEEWMVVRRTGALKSLYYWWDDASETTPSLWLAVRHLEGKTSKPWTLELTLHWERL